MTRRLEEPDIRKGYYGPFATGGITACASRLTEPGAIKQKSIGRVLAGHLIVIEFYRTDLKSDRAGRTVKAGSRMRLGQNFNQENMKVT